ncbi:MAG: alpha/beta fold hydrolase [Flammeovirgaceae bacterium]|nr:MAG: alpha/beta fold hydrolase [Flammeovirgaceae bacterium]
MNYSPPIFLFNGHLETIYPALLRKVTLQPYHRERITTPDNDFLDLDWLKQGSEKLVIISHGLEGNTHRAYIKGMARALFLNGFDVLAWNYRGCSEEMNRQLRFYHSGATDDLAVVINHAVKQQYKAINLVGFSLGGNLTLKYLGEPRKHPDVLRKAIVFSVPLDLHTSCLKISQPSNWIYANRFLVSLKEKVQRKARMMPELDSKGLGKIKSLMEFDDVITGPLHGFSNALDYYAQCSSIKFVNGINHPVLIINAKNDPFLSKECYPVNELEHHSKVKFIAPQRGGHVGFAEFNSNGLYWSERQAIAFLTHD